jgi:prophage maintenance system killer protein
VLAVHLVKNHALPDGYKRVGYLALGEFCERNGGRWVPPAADDPGGDETVRVVLALAAGELDVPQLTQWVAARLAK